MLSEGSCDNENWSNDAENSALPSGMNEVVCVNENVMLNCHNIT